MYAIIKTGGKQYRVQPGDRLRVEKLEQKLGSTFDINEVLFMGGDQPQMGTPLLKGAKVSAVVTQHGKEKKVLIFKKKRRKGMRRMKGHRQPFTELFIAAITSPSGQTLKAETEPHIIDREAIAEKKAQHRAAQQSQTHEEKQARAEKRAESHQAKKSQKKVAKKKTAAKKGAKKSAKAKTKKKAASKK
jgi:large subunit ribosomal protein L21